MLSDAAPTWGGRFAPKRWPTLLRKAGRFGPKGWPLYSEKRTAWPIKRQIESVHHFGS